MSTTCDNIDMKLGEVTKLDKKNKTTAEKVDDDIMSKNCDAIVIFQFTANLEQAGSLIPDAYLYFH